MKKLLLLLTVGFAGSVTAHADLMPSFATAPTGWTTDRYDPASFGNVGVYAGRSDVLGIGIDSTGSLANRTAGFNSSFYNTQGKAYAISGGAGSSISADIYIESGWDNGANGNVRSDMWGVISPDPLQYPIIGFTNYGGAARFRVWDADTTDGWVDLTTTVVTGAWTALSIGFTGTGYDFFINGTNVYSDSTVAGATGFSSVIMQAYNFGDPSIAGANAADYTAHWSNVAAVPEPTSMLLLGSVLVGAGFIMRRRKRSTIQ